MALQDLSDVRFAGELDEPSALDDVEAIEHGDEAEELEGLLKT